MGVGHPFNIFYFTKKIIYRFLIIQRFRKSKEAEIQSCFSCSVEFHCPKTINSFDNMLEQFKLRSQTAKLTLIQTLIQLLKIPVI